MNNIIETYVETLGDNSKAEKELASLLRKEPTETRLDFIKRLNSSPDPKVFRASFRLAKTCLSDRPSVVSFLLFGLKNADASTISNWLAIVAPKLGDKKLIQVLSGLVESDPASVVKARYWLRKYLSNKNQAKQNIQALDQRISTQIKGDRKLEELFASIVKA